MRKSHDKNLQELRSKYLTLYNNDFVCALMNTCRYCGKQVLDYYIDGPDGSAGDYRHIDHVIPLSSGGVDSVDNIVISCAACNTKKGVRLFCVVFGGIISIDDLRNKYDPSLKYKPDSAGSRINRCRH